MPGVSSEVYRWHERNEIRYVRGSGNAGDAGVSCHTEGRKNVMAVLMLAENVISPDAVKMGDVITTLAGKTVEVYNTDAEGRLVCVTVSRLRSVWGRAP